ncbi:MAG: GNAT family N-acetyltransferase [Magnetococcales bacterium]|nr:GNAT family N-acetyltransferase [Magnetococcales bacterium]
MKEGFVHITALEKQQRMEVARLAYTIMPEWYDLFGVPVDILYTHIAGQLGEKNTEFENGFALLNAKGVAGFYTAYPGREMNDRKFFTLFSFVKSFLPEQRKTFKDKVLDLKAHLFPVHEDSYYLARIAVDNAWRGQGVADKLLSHFNNTIDQTLMSLHVQSDNKKAISLYSRHGYIEHNHGDSPHTKVIVMSKVSKSEYLGSVIKKS